MKFGTVESIVLSDSENDTLNSIIVSITTGGTGRLIRCFPLSINSRHIPTLGEQVYVITANSDLASGTGQGAVRDYYIAPVALQNNLNNNALPKLTIKDVTSNGDQYGNASSGISFSSNSSTQVDLGTGFEEVSNLSQLQGYIGDVIHEGRFGQSIRFGYTPEGVLSKSNKVSRASVKPSWTSTDPKSPITIIRNGAGNSNGYNKFVIEDINEDDSSIWLGSKQTIKLKSSQKFGFDVTGIGVYNKPQIIINSERIIINSKKDSVLISGKKSVNISTPNWKADMDVIFSQLESITDALLKLAPAITAATAGFIPVASLNTAGPQLLSAITQVKTQLQLMKQ
jgi:hypothetical protein